MSSAVRSVQVEVEASELDAPAADHGEDLYTNHFNFVWRNLRRLGVPAPQLEDAAQDVFLTAHRRWDSYDSQRASPQSWLFGIALRVARDYRRTFRRRLARLVSLGEGREAEASSEIESPAAIVERRQSLVLLDRILETIDEDKRAVLLLVDVEELSVTEAADVLGVNLNTLYWRLRVARQSFQRGVERLRLTEARTQGGALR
ncbi:MAG: RNA polymerase sigma factor [Myxococcota bacterium]